MRGAVASALLLVLSHASAAVNGTIVDDYSGQPLAHCLIRVQAPSQVFAEVETDSAGRFQLPTLPDGPYRLHIAKPNYVSAILDLTLGRQLPEFVVRLVRFGVISGRVSFIGGAAREVRVVALKAAKGALRPFGEDAQVDARGMYHLSLPPGQYSVAAVYGDRWTAAKRRDQKKRSATSGVTFYPSNREPQFFTIVGGEEYPETNFTVVPRDGYSISGRVFPSGIRYLVALAPIDRPELPLSAQLATIEGADSKSGFFSMAGIPPGSYHLYATQYDASPNIPSRDALSAGVRVDLLGQDVDGLELRAETGTSVSLALRSVSSAPLCPPRGAVTLSMLEGRGGARIAGRSVEVSTAEARLIERLLPARYLVTTSLPGDSCFVEDVVVDARETRPTPVVLAATPAAVVRGRVSGSEAPEDVLIVLAPYEPADGTPGLMVRFPDRSFGFTFTGLRPGRYGIGAIPARYPYRGRMLDPGHLMQIDVRGGSYTEVALAAGAGN